MQSTLKLFIFLTACFFLPQSTIASSLADDSLDKSRALFLDAEKALQAGNNKQFTNLKQQLTDYPLYPYLVYQELRKNLHRKSAPTVRQFLDNYSQTPLARRLLSAWLKQLARQKKWQEYIDFYHDGFGITLQCYYLEALLKTGKQEKAWPLITDVWLHKKSRPSSCDPVFKQWQEAGYQTNALTWQRISLAIDASQIRLARYLAKSLPEKDNIYFDQWLKLRSNPETISLTTITASHPYRQLALTQGVEKLARKDLPRALTVWEQFKHGVIDDPEMVARAEKALSLQFLKKPSEDEIDYLIFAEPCDPDTKLQEIRIRAAMLHNQWQEVLVWLDYMPDKQRNDDRWMYWRARALQLTGKANQANEIFDHLAGNRSFYGFLSADLRNKDYAMNHAELAVDNELYADVRAQPAMQRTRELLQLERYLDARREWYFIAETFDEDELLAAAKLAHEWQWHDRAILTLAQAKSWNDLSIRFPIEHKQFVLQEAENNEIDPAWIYAMMRQESAFMQDAQSSVGALGLMQLMPRTAKSVAKTLKQRKPSKKDLFEPEKNIKLGTAYLKQVYDKFDENPVLAIAAYNAGPNRVKRWLPENTMPADIWIEMVPFRETRNYLKSVLAYTVIYADKLGFDEMRISERMPDIAARKVKGPVTAMNQ